MTDSALTVAVLGTGTMGAPMARSLLRAGFGVQVWNRTSARAAVVGVDARRASTPAEAAAGADVLITILADGAAVEDVMTGPKGALSTLPPGAIFTSAATIASPPGDRLAVSGT
jgi:3-hydroxyisobutyrate dehydrogenase